MKINHAVRRQMVVDGSGQSLAAMHDRGYYGAVGGTACIKQVISERFNKR